MAAKQSFIFVLLFYTTVICDVMTLEKRSDDVNIESLMTLIQQQAATIQATQAQLTSLQTTVHQQSSTIVDLSTKLTAANNTFTSELKNINTRMDTGVSFTAHMASGTMTVGTSNSPFKFDDVISNIGGAYNPASGVFTAPVSGVYVFYAQLMNHDVSRQIGWVIDKSGTVLCMSYLHYSMNYDRSSCQATVRVQKGEQVFVRRHYGDSASQILEGGWFCSFSGFLLSTDS